MIPLIVLVVTFLLCLAAGAAGWHAMRDWQTALSASLAIMFLVTASAHWGRMRTDMIRMVPPRFRKPGFLVTITGLLEIAGACGLLVPSTRRIAAACLGVLLVAMFPANIHAAKTKQTIRGKTAPPLGFRLPLQVLFIGCLIAVAVG